MRLTSPRSKGVGKVGSSVYSINHGVQIEREYNPHVSNPSTTSQVSQRSRFKLASQVSASLEQVIAIPRKGILSPRNRFVQRNMGFFYGSPDGAHVSYENLQLTLGAKGLPRIEASRSTSGKLRLELERGVYPYYTHVAYSIFVKNDDGSLLLYDSTIIEVTDGVDAAFYETDDIAGNLVIYAYGYSLKTAKAKAKYDSYKVETATDMATLIANRRIETSDVYFTNTRGTTLLEDASSNVTPDSGEAMLYISTSDGVTVDVKIGQEEVAEVQNSSFAVKIGTEVTLTAKVLPGYAFLGWYNNGEQRSFDANSVVEFVMSDMRDIIARGERQGLE